MTPKEYIIKRLEGIKNIATKPEGKLGDFIYGRLMSKKFRKYSVNDETKDMVRGAVELNIKNNEPIRIALPYGAYKLWSIEESPEVDWAELFAMIYYSYWLKPITDIYKPGVYFDFCGDDAILELMNNIPPEDTEQYKKSFRDLMKFVQSYLPENLKLNFNPVGERYSSKEEFLLDLNGEIEKLKAKGDPELTDRRITMAEFNIKHQDGEKIDFKENRIIHDAYMNVSKRRPAHKAPNIITICNYPFGGASLPVGSTKTSIVKFQTGVGVLKKELEGFKEYILSPSQVETAKPIFEPISIEGLSGKNFNKIRVAV